MITSAISLLCVNASESGVCVHISDEWGMLMM